jgi:hypothetical protein
MQHIVDLKNGTLYKASIPPQTVNANTNGVGVDLVSCDGRSQALISFGTLAANTVVYVTVQESDDNTTFAALADTANTNTGNLNTSNTVTALGFQRSKRYLRAVATIAGTNASAPMSVEIIEQRKRSPSDDSGYSASPAG